MKNQLLNLLPVLSVVSFILGMFLDTNLDVGKCSVERGATIQRLDRAGKRVQVVPTVALLSGIGKAVTFQALGRMIDRFN